jgi:alkaline phosphatase D
MLRLSKRNLLGLTASLVSLPRMLWAQSNVTDPRLMEGPMVGAVTPASVTIWARVSGPTPVSIEYSPAANFANSKRTAPVIPAREDDYTVRITIDGLTAATPCYYRVIVGDQLDRYQALNSPYRTRTAPAITTRGRFTVALGSCVRIQQDMEQPIWKQVMAANPDLFFWIGDNIYADAQEPEVFAEEYRRQRAVPGLQPVIRSVPQLAMWDDHDFGVNDGDRTNPTKDMALRLFKQYWANPSYGLPETPGVFFKYQYGGIDFFFLDDRYYRDPNKQPSTPQKTFLGTGQLAWLKAGLKASKAPFKILLSGSGWSIGKGPDGDAWSACLDERNALFDYIRENAITGVVLASGDTHVAELNCIPWSEKGGYDLYDLTTSPLAQRTESNWVNRRPEIRIRQVFAGDSNFGLMTFDTAGEPTLTYNVIDTRGRAAWAPFTITAGQLKNGVTSWRSTIDKVSLRNHERWKSGGSYYLP